MANEELMWARARDGLVIPDGRGDGDVFLWEHTVRVTRAARHIAGAPDVPHSELDLAALVAAALYHDMGWAAQFREGILTRAEILAKPTSDAQRDLAVTLLEKQLADLLSPGSLKRAAEAVRTYSRRDCALVEAAVLADARGLDEIGALSLWHTVRRHVMEGKGVQAALDTWQRQQEYRFWKARLDSFRFDSVRELARRRFERFEVFMAALAEEHTGQDLGVPQSSEALIGPPRRVEAR